ncbi:MAG: HAD family phosphatase [Erysipelotrichia bacterium]|nr:HAD family phosphatase [Erysipelotrichia bacterium]NCC54134.1 HAD family phosphatase [Erysipelotrichia bacterium]
MKKLKAVIFDMDGVLFDTERVYMQRLNTFMGQDGKQISNEAQMYLLGSSDQQKWQYIEKLYEYKYTRDEFFARYDKHYAQAPFSYKKIMFDGVKEVLMTLYQEGYQLALASSSMMKEIEDALTQCQLKALFTSVLSGENCIATKPDPQIYLDTLTNLGLAKQECIVVEDSEYGIIAAKRAGLKVIARKDEYIRVDQSKADYIIQEHHQILEIIHQIEKEK